MVLAASVVDFTEFFDGHAAIPEGKVVDIALQIVAVVCGTVLADIPCHAASDEQA